MPDLLLNYMNKRLLEQQLLKKDDPGPVITISRECGCGARNIAQELASRLNKKSRPEGKKVDWHWIDKEILHQSAEKLNLNPSLVNRVLTDKERGSMDEILSAMSNRYFKTDQKIRKTTFDVIRSFVIEGNVIIIGRGGEIASQDIRRSLHIRLEAPEEWRIESIIQLRQITRNEAIKYIHGQDELRNNFLDKVLYGKSSNLLYDIIINRSKFNEADIVDTILHLAEAKGICQLNQ
jgi:cytidylate kinase